MRMQICSLPVLLQGTERAYCRRLRVIEEGCVYRRQGLLLDVLASVSVNCLLGFLGGTWAMAWHLSLIV